MSLILTVILFWVLLIFSITIFKDYLHPAVIFCVPWCVFLTFLPQTGFSFDPSSMAYLYFAFGGIIFIFGTCFGNSKFKINERVNAIVEVYYPNYSLLRLLMLLEIAFTIYTYIAFYRFIRSNYSINIFLAYYVNRTEFGAEGIINYGRNIVLAAVLSMILGYSHVAEEEKSKYKKYLFIELFFYLALSITRMTRNGILSSVLPVLCSIVIIRKEKNKTILKWAILGIVGMIILFSVVSILKSPYLYENGNYVKELTHQFSLYGTGGFVAFQNQFDLNQFPRLNGANTFRTLIAVWDKIAGTKYAPPLIQKFMSIGNDTLTNVYTFYHWYASDFGILYAWFIQFLVGMFHGKIYRQMVEYRLFGMYKYCIFLYPLIMQIFQDQYFSLLSSWIQLLVFGTILLRTNILFSRSTVNRNKLIWYKNE